MTNEVLDITHNKDGSITTEYSDGTTKTEYPSDFDHKRAFESLYRQVYNIPEPNESTNERGTRIQRDDDTDIIDLL